MRRLISFPPRAAILAACLAAIVSALAPGRACATTFGSADSFGAVPSFAGTGLFGTYYNSGNPDIYGQGTLPVLAALDPGNGTSFITSYTPIATFTTTNICFPDCTGNSFDDGSGGFVATVDNSTSFSNGNVSNVNFFPDVSIPTTWDESGLDINGFLAITTPGTYIFSLGSDDNSSLSIAGQNILTIAGCCETISTSVTFNAAGLYAIGADLLEFGGGSYLNVTATDPNGNCFFGCSDANGGYTQTGLYYSADQFQGAPAPTIGGGLGSMFVLLMLAGGGALRQYRHGKA